MPAYLRDSWKVAVPVVLLLAAACGGSASGPEEAAGPASPARAAAARARADDRADDLTANLVPYVAPAATPAPVLDAHPPEPPAAAPEPAADTDAPVSYADESSVLAPAAVSDVPPPAPPAGRQDAGLADTLVNLINQVRAQNGLPPLAVAPSLAAAARGYAQFHFENADPFQLSHYLDGTPGDRVQREGYGGGGAGEVLAAGPPSAQAFLDLWLSSPAHRAILLGPDYRDVGVGCFGGPYAGDDGSVMDAALCVADLGAP